MDTNPTARNRTSTAATPVVEESEVPNENFRRKISWGAIIAGALVAVSCTMRLLGMALRAYMQRMRPSTLKHKILHCPDSITAPTDVFCASWDGIIRTVIKA